MNQLSPWERIKIYDELLHNIENLCDSTKNKDKEVIKRLIAAAKTRMDLPVAPKCWHCHDTGYEDVRGQCRCRNKCTVR
jgi:hypothetical protein